MSSKSSTALKLAFGVCGLLVALTGCREAELGRPLHYEKGVYQGAVDEKLNAEDRNRLIQRGLKQQYI